MLKLWTRFRHTLRAIVGEQHKHGLNNLSRWHEYGGTLKRPIPPAPMNAARNMANRNGLWTLPPVSVPMPEVKPTLGPRPNPLSRCPECGR